MLRSTVSRTAQCRRQLQFSAVVCPVQDGLPLSPPALEIAWFAVLPNRRDVPRDRPPAPDLPRVVGGSAAHVVAAIPLEPPAWILLVDPSVAAPDGERLRGVDAEAVQPRIMPLGAQPGAGEPAAGNSSRQSVMYLPPKTPSSSICFGDSSGRETAARSSGRLGSVRS